MRGSSLSVERNDAEDRKGSGGERHHKSAVHAYRGCRPTLSAKQDDGHRHNRHRNHPAASWPPQTGQYGNSIISGTTSEVKPATSGRSGRSVRARTNIPTGSTTAQNTTTYATSTRPTSLSTRRVESAADVVEGERVRLPASNAYLRPCRRGPRGVDRLAVEDPSDHPAMAGGIAARGNERDAPQPSEPRERADRDTQREQPYSMRCAEPRPDRGRRPVVPLRALQGFAGAPSGAGPHEREHTSQDEQEKSECR